MCSCVLGFLRYPSYVSIFLNQTMKTLNLTGLQRQSSGKPAKVVVPPKKIIPLEELPASCNDPLEVGDCCESFETACKDVLMVWYPNGRFEPTVGEELGELLEDYQDVPTISRCPCKQVLSSTTEAAAKLIDFEKGIADWKSPLNVDEKRRKFDEASEAFTAELVQFDKYMAAFKRLQEKDARDNKKSKRAIRTRKTKYQQALEKKGIPSSFAKVIAPIAYGHDQAEADVQLTLGGALDFDAVGDDGPYSVEQFENRARGVNLPADFGGLGGMLRRLTEASKPELTKIANDGINHLKISKVCPITKEKKIARHCFKSMKLKTPWSWALNDGCSLSEMPCERVISRIFEVERFSMSPDTFPLNGTAGLLVVLSGVVCVMVLSADMIAEEMDIHRYLNSIKDDVLSDEAVAIVGAGRAVWIPFGHVAVLCGLSANRSTLDKNMDSRGRPKVVKDAEREFCNTLWIGCYGQDDAKNEASIRNSVMARLQSQKSSLPSSFETLANWQTWHSIMLAAGNDDSKKGSDE